MISKLILVEDDKITFDSNPRYKKGDVIVSGITSSAPNGFIRNVTEYRKQKENTLYKQNLLY